MKIDQSYVTRWQGRDRAGFFYVKIARLAFFCLETLIPQKSNSIVFLFWGDTGYAGNSRHLFEHLVLHRHPDAKLLIYQRTLFEQLQSAYPRHAVYAFSYKGLITFCRASTVVISSAIWRVYFLPYFISERRKFILNLWHGVPLKRLAFQVRNWRKKGSRFDVQTYSKLICSSHIEQLILASCFRMSIDDIPITGAPRNDCLKRHSKFDRNRYLAKTFTSIPSESKILLYAPTWRDSGEGASFLPFADLDLKELNHLLQLTNTYIILRGHHIERAGLDTKSQFKDCLRVVSGDFVDDAQELLLLADFLLTDYSSIFFDYLLLDRPIIFAPYDADAYAAYRGFMLPYAECTPGPKVDSFKDFAQVLRSLVAGNDEHNELRRDVLRRFHTDTSVSACAALSQMIANASQNP